MQSKVVFLTSEGLINIETEIGFLKTVRRKEIAEKIKAALAFGDIAENAEYDDAKNEQAKLEKKIMKLEEKLSHCQIIDEKKISKSNVGIGSTVCVKDIEFDETLEYKIVGATEADPYESKISNESPVGSALLGRKVGDVVEVVVPDGFAKFEIIRIG